MTAKPPCASCGGVCIWAEDAWVCWGCGDEWYPDHNPTVFANPFGPQDPPDDNDYRE